MHEFSAVVAAPMEEASFRGSGLSPHEFFAQVENLFAQAQSKGKPAPYRYKIAEQNVYLRFASDVLAARLTPALAHKQLFNAAIDDDFAANALTVCLWDSVSSGIEMPPTPWDNTEYSIRNEVRGWSDARFRTTFHMGSGVLTLLDLERNRAILWIRDARELPYYESGAPLLPIFHAWMKERQRRLVHAAAIGNERGGVLLVGRGGSGKSSTALQTFTSNLLYAADDYCLLSEENDELRAWSLYSSGKVHGEDAQFFPHLQSSLSNETAMMNEKALYFFHPLWQHKLGEGFPIRAILLPRVTNQGAPQMRPLSRAQALLALAPSTIFQLPNAGRETFEWLSALVRRVPSYTLDLGKKRSAVLPFIEEFLRNQKRHDA